MGTPCSPKNSISGKVSVAGMAAGIAPINMNPFPNPDARNCWHKKKAPLLQNRKLPLQYRIMAKRKPASAAGKRKEGKLQSLLPSGKKDHSFFEQVYEVARLIPRGRVSSYGAIAAYLGTKMSARMVGWAMNGAGQVKPKVPAHRVVNRKGVLSGKMHFTTPTTMEELLKKEKIEVENDTVLNFEKKFWDPMKELGEW